MGTTANRGWPYPESSDFVADGATAIENLADAIDASLGEGYAYVETVYFTASGSFTKASYPWLRAVRLRVLGAGGGGGGIGTTTTTQWAGGAGGGSGAYAESFVLEGALSASETVTIGAAGAGGIGANDGTAGGTTTFFGIDCGGGGGGSSFLTTAGAGFAMARPGPRGSVTAGTPDLQINGSAGSPPVTPTSRNVGGNGADSQIGAGGPGGNAVTAASGPGLIATGYGAGGGGAAVRYGTVASQNGGDGTAGVVILELFA